jgi:hypothetical protein
MRVACDVRLCRYSPILASDVDSGRFDIATVSNDFLPFEAVV